MRVRGGAGADTAAQVAPNWWYRHLSGGLTVAFGHLFVHPDSAASSIAFLAVAISGVIAIAIGPARRALSWRLLLAGTALMLLGDVSWIAQQHLLRVDPFPSVADALYLPGYPLLAAGLTAFVRQRSSRSGKGSLIDATIIATGLGVLAWFFVLAGYFDDVSLSMTQRTISAAYPLAGIALVAVVTQLAFVRRSATVPDLLLAAGVVSLLAADIVLGVIEVDTGYLWHPIAEFLWLAMYVTFGAAALHPDATAVPTAATAMAERDAGPSDVSRPRFAALMVASLMAPVMLLAHADGRDRNVIVMATASALLSMLVLLRMRELLHRVQRQADELARLATIDPLTGIANRRCWNREISRFIADAERRGHPLSVALLDLDNFKRYNDAKGHLAGDDLLLASASLWRELLRPTDFLARYGGEEFAIALPRTSPRAATAVLERLRETMPDGQTFSGGIAEWYVGDTPEQLLGRADQALYAAKANGRDRVQRAPRPPTYMMDANATVSAATRTTDLPRVSP